MKRRILPPIIAICILFFIVCIEVIAGNTHTNDEISIPVITTNLEMNGSINLNESEKMIVNLLTNGIMVSEDLDNIKENKDYGIYLRHLTDHLSATDIDLTSSYAYEVANKIIALNRIMNLEEESKYQKMSLDGRELAIRLSEQIYELCGLKVLYNIHGDLVQISDAAGEALYTKEVEVGHSDFQMEALMITITVLMILLAICLIIAKKNQLFIKDGMNDGFSKEEFAR
jgi:hypothetical protein